MESEVREVEIHPTQADIEHVEAYLVDKYSAITSPTGAVRNSK